MSSMHTSVETPPAPVPMDPRIRQRRIDVRRAAGRRRRRVVVAGTTLLGALVLVYGVTRSPLLDVDAVKVRGLDRTPVDEAVVAAGLGGGQQMTDLDLARVRTRVEALPWVRAVEVRRDWPGTVTIAVTERRAVGLLVAPSGEHFAFIDADGRILGHAPPEAGDLALIVGAGEVPAPGLHIVGAAEALRLLAALDGRPAVAELHVRAPFVEAVLKGGAVVQFGHGDELEDKIVALRTLATRVDLSTVAVIDVRVPSAPALTRR